MAQVESPVEQKLLYPLPRASESTEKGRLDEQHEVMKLLFNGLYLRPNLVADTLSQSDDQKRSILDLGSGSGAWCLDMAQAFPHAQVVGLDVASSRLQTVLSNCRFELWDLNKSLAPFYGQFDFVHMRFVHGLANHHNTMLEAIKCLKPGGLIMFFKNGPLVNEDRVTFCPPATSRVPEGYWFQRLWHLMDLSAGQRGSRYDIYAQDYDAGFWDHDGIDASKCGAAYLTSPVGSWAPSGDPAEAERLRKIGEFWKENILRVQRVLGVHVAATGRSAKDVEIMHKRIEEDLETLRIHSAVTLRAIWGRASTAGGSADKIEESHQVQDESFPALSNEQGFQLMTTFDSKASWTRFNENLMSTMMTSDVKGLREVPGFDPIEE